MILNELKNRGILRAKTYQGVDYLALATPVQKVITPAVWKALKTMYVPTYEKGGMLLGTPQSDGSIVMDELVIMPNDMPAAQQTISYKYPSGLFWATVNRAFNTGKLPFKFHTHPVTVGSLSIANGSANLFQKTSITDRHSSYFALSDGQNKLILPDGLLVANDALGKDIQFYLYNGFITPTSLRRLFESQQISIVVLLLAVIGLYLIGQRKAFIIGVILLIGIATFIVTREEIFRPKISETNNGGLLIDIPKQQF